jgi:hypothetical protein
VSDQKTYYCDEIWNDARRWRVSNELKCRFGNVSKKNHHDVDGDDDGRDECCWFVSTATMIQVIMDHSQQHCSVVVVVVVVAFDYNIHDFLMFETFPKIETGFSRACQFGEADTNSSTL